MLQCVLSFTLLVSTKLKEKNKRKCLTFVPVITNNDEVRDVCAQAVEEDAEGTDHQRHLAAARLYTFLIVAALVSFGTKYHDKHGADDQKGKYLHIADNNRLVKTWSGNSKEPAINNWYMCLSEAFCEA